MTMTPSTRKQFDDLAGGLFLMAMFTAIWIIIAEANLTGRDYWVATGVFGLIIIYFITVYNKLTKTVNGMPKEPVVEDAAEKARDKRFYYIFAIEGIAIFIIRILLDNTGHSNLFFPFFALIVGLHFFPLAKLYSRRFYYLLAVWMCLMGIIGLALTYLSNAPTPVISGIVGIGCAFATTANGLRISRQGNALLKSL